MLPWEECTALQKTPAEKQQGFSRHFPVALEIYFHLLKQDWCVDAHVGIACVWIRWAWRIPDLADSLLRGVMAPS